jgi:Predicted signal transduction protein with a C-terminal ATPase domain
VDTPPESRRLSSLKSKLGLFFAAVAVPIAALLIFQNVYAVSVVHRQVAETKRDMLKLEIGRVDADLQGIDRYLVSKLVNDSKIGVLDRAVVGDEYSLVKFDLAAEFGRELPLYPSVGGAFAYVPSRDDLIATRSASSDLSLDGREALRRTLRDSVGVPTRSWRFAELGSRSVLLRVLRSETCLLGAWVDVNNVLERIDQDRGAGRDRFILISEGGKPYPELSELASNRVELSAEEGSYRVSGKPEAYLVTQAKSGMGPFRLVDLVPDDTLLQQLPAFRTTNLIVATFALLLVFAFFITVRKATLKPLEELMDGMTRLRRGDFSARIEPGRTSREFAVAGETFNLMASEIRDLRINVYEEQLRARDAELHAQKAELLSLRLQINPHFFLNSLNIIHQLAQVGNTALIQELARCLSKYFQFMNRSKADLVSLEDEWGHLRNYLRIQELRFPTNLVCELEAPEPMPEIDIPPLLLHTFAENAVQHGARQDRPLKIHVSIRLAPEAGRLELLVEDSGPGFPEAVIAAFAAGRPVMGPDGERVGIANIRRRLDLLYGEAARLTIKNRPAPESGAIVEISVPMGN